MGVRDAFLNIIADKYVTVRYKNKNKIPNKIKKKDITQWEHLSRREQGEYHFQIYKKTLFIWNYFVRWIVLIFIVFLFFKRN